MKRFLSFLCILTMLFSCLSVFSACSKGNDGPKASKKEIAVDLTGYHFVYGAELSADCCQDINDFSDKLRTVFSLLVPVMSDRETSVVENEDKEILIGMTNREETQKALKKVKGEGWVIRVFDNKIVIVGTTPFLTRVAFAYFAKNYGTADKISGTTVSVNKKVLLSGLETVSIAEEYTVIYSELVDDQTGPSEHDRNNVSVGGTKEDYTYTVVKDAQSLISKTLQLSSGVVRVSRSRDSESEAEREVMVGKVDRESYMAELNKIEANEFGIAVRDGDIMLLAWNDTTLEKAYEFFEELLASSAVENEDGTKSYLVPNNFSGIAVYPNDWTVDFPKLKGEGIQLHGTEDAGDGAIEYIYSGDGISYELFSAYCDELESAGFAAIGAENYDAETGVAARTYLNETSGVLLHVYHSPYKYAAELDKIGMNDVLASIRIVVAPTDSVTAPTAAIMTPQSYTQKTETKMISLMAPGNSSSHGMGYIMVLADGTFVIIDGGEGAAGETDNEVRLWNVLKKLNDEINGAGAPIHVRAWFLSHEHYDHYNVMQRFLMKYGKSGFKMDYLLTNATSSAQQFNAGGGSNAVMKHLEAMQNAVSGGFTYIKVHTGQKYYFANCEIEILYTQEDAYPKKLEWFNNSSTVIRTTLTVGNSKTKTIFLGDAEYLASRRLRALYGETLQCEMLQYSHHASYGCEKELYDLVAPELLFIPYKSSRYAECLLPSAATNTYFPYRVNYHAFTKISSIKLVVLAGELGETYPDVYITITDSGAERDGQGKYVLHDVMTNEIVAGDGVNFIYR